jgi:L-threonylcarbamoyladenylate synthase
MLATASNHPDNAIPVSTETTTHGCTDACNHAEHHHHVSTHSPTAAAHSHSPVIGLCDSVERAVHLLLDGQLVAIPTETVYGLAADALNDAAVADVFTLKGRPTHHPLIVHVGEGKGWQAWFESVPPPLLKLATAFWPGSLTIVAPKAVWVPTTITGGKPTVAVRMPSHPMALAVLNQLGGGIVAPSANAFGHISPTTAQHVVEGLAHQTHETGIPLQVLDGDACEVGVESTLVLWREDLACVQLLRPGHITKTMLESVLEAPVLWEPLYITEANATQAPASGTLASHYAPTKPCWHGSLATLATALQGQDATTIAIISLQPIPPTPEFATFTGLWHNMPTNPSNYAQAFYAVLHVLDADNSIQQIWIETPPTAENPQAWLAVMDRLLRASTPLVPTSYL